MRRLAATLAGACLTVLLAGSVVAAQPAAARNSFTGDFDVIDPDTGLIAGHVIAQFTLPTERQVGPGTFQFTGAGWYSIKEMRMAVANSLFWIDPNGGLPHAMEMGAECDILWPGGYTCAQDWAVMFRVVPDEPNSILMSRCRISEAPDGFDFDVENGCGTLLWVGKGGWVLKVAPE